jgi:intein/homing endonuclease
MTKSIQIYNDFEHIIHNKRYIYAVTQKSVSYDSKYSFIKYILDNNIKPRKTKIEQIQHKDIIYEKIDTNIVDINKIDIVPLIKNKNNYQINKFLIKNKYSPVYHKRYIEIDNLFCMWLGLYVADGHTETRGTISICSNLNEHKNHKLCTQTMSKFGNVRIKKYNNRNAISHIINNSPMSQLMIQWCKKKDKKQLPDWCLSLPLDKIKSILIGLFMGDGSYNKENGFSSYYTISYKLYQQIKIICKKLGIHYSVSYSKANKNKKSGYRFNIKGNLKTSNFPTQYKNIYMNNETFYCYKVKGVK